ncbi:MAG: alpha/beta hydrolase [Candidatus Hydrogenedentota bacterium]
MSPALGESSTIEVGGGVALFRHFWLISDPKAHVLIVHGYGEHCTRYYPVARRLNDRGYSVYSYDHRGHGRSPGKLGHVPSFDAVIDDLKVVFDSVQGGIGDEPLFIWGHSMGGLITTAFTVRNQPEVEGLVLTSPGVKSDGNVSPVLIAMSGLIAAFLPWMPVHALDANGISRVQKEVDKYVNDPMVYHGKILARTGNGMMNTIKEVESKLGTITLPFIARHGTEDSLVHHSASELLFEKASSEDKTLKLYDGGYHELFNDECKEEFFSDLLGWLNARC